MEKKNLKKIALSLGLVGVVGVGATLAYFSANTTELTNTFRMFGNETGQAIGLTIKEHAVDKDNNPDYRIHEDTLWTKTTENDGVTYDNLLPNQIVDKDPTIEVAANSVNCIVVAKVENYTQEYLTILGQDSENWEDITELVNNPGTTKYFKYKEVVTTKDEVTPLPKIFAQVQVSNTIEELNPDENIFKEIKVKDVAVQSEHIDSDDEALKKLGAELKSVTPAE